MWTMAALVVAGAVAIPATPDSVTYHKDVEPIVRRKCLPCHRPRGPGPFPLLTYDDVAKRANLVWNVAALRKMPPTFAESDYGPMTLYSHLTDQELSVLQEWIRLDRPMGEPSREPPSPPPPRWRLGPPDMIVPVRGERTLAEGPPNWRAYPVSMPPGEKRQIVAFDVVPAEPKVLRQVLLSRDPRGDGPRLDARDSGPGYATLGDPGTPSDALIGAWALGYTAWRLPSGAGIAPGDLVVQALYSTTGLPEPADFEVGLYFARDPASRSPRWLELGGDDFEIGLDEQVTLFDDVVLEEDVEVVAVVPEARNFARQIRVFAAPPEPNASPRTLLFIYQWDMFWAGAYRLDRPALLKKGTRIVAEIQYNNKRHRDAKEDGASLPIRSGPGLQNEKFRVRVQIIPVSGRSS
jgi:hypothetical protein